MSGGPDALNPLEPRATNDIDIVVAMMPHRIGAFVKELGPDFEVGVSAAEMDSAYLRSWAERLKIEDLLSRAEAETKAGTASP